MLAPAARRSRTPYQSAPGMVSDVLPGLCAAGGMGESRASRTNGPDGQRIPLAPAGDEDRTGSCFAGVGAYPLHQPRTSESTVDSPTSERTKKENARVRSLSSL